MENNHGKNLKKPGKAPLWVWIVVGISFATTIFFANLLPNRIEQQFFYPHRLRKFQQTDSSVLKIVVIGSSRVLHAFFYDEDMEEFARKNGFPKIQFIKFVQSSAKFEDFDSILKPIYRAKPDIVFWEDALVWKKESLLDRQNMDARRKLRIRIREWIGKNSQDKNSINSPEFERDRISTNNLLSQNEENFRNYRERLENYQMRPFGLPEEYETFRQEIQKFGGRIVLLDVPISNQKSTRPAKIQQTLDSFCKQYWEKYGWQHIVFPCSLGLEYYQDFAHLNRKGREKYCLWFLSQLSSLAKENKP